MKAFEEVNWAKQIHAHLMKSISRGILCLGTARCNIVLKDVLPSSRNTDPSARPLKAGKPTIEGWKTSLLGCEITPMPVLPQQHSGHSISFPAHQPSHGGQPHSQLPADYSYAQPDDHSRRGGA